MAFTNEESLSKLLERIKETQKEKEAPKPLESGQPRFINVGHVIINQYNPKNKDPVVIKDVGHLIGVRETNEVRKDDSGKSDHIYSVDFFNKASNQIDRIKFSYSAYSREDINLFCSLIEQYLEKNKKLEMFKEYSAHNPIASAEDIWIKVEESWNLLKSKELTTL